MYDVTNIGVALIVLITALITAFLIPYIKSKTTGEQFESLMLWAQIAVEAAEQVLGSGKGKEKKQMARDFLFSKGFSYDEDVINIAIESAVRTLKMNGGEVE